MGPSNPDESPEERQKPLKTERLHRESRRYFLDLKENNRGRYLRIRQQTAYNGQQNGQPGQQQPQQVYFDYIFENIENLNGIYILDL